MYIHGFEASKSSVNKHDLTVHVHHLEVREVLNYHA
jgi:hypothetical protein